MTIKITHHSDIDISKFHSRLFCVIGFFGKHLKFPSFVQNFFHYFSRVADKMNSLRREFHFFPTTLGFWDFRGSVGTFGFFHQVSTFLRWVYSGLQILVGHRHVHLRYTAERPTSPMLEVMRLGSRGGGG